MRIRDISARDVDEIQGLYDAFYPMPAPDVRTLAETAQFRIAESEGSALSGVMSLSPSGFLWIAVRETDRHRGIGRALMNDALALRAQRGIGDLTSRVSDMDSAGLAFCTACDFHPYLHMVNLDLDLQTWDDSVFTPPRESAAASGI